MSTQKTKTSEKVYGAPPPSTMLETLPDWLVPLFKTPGGYTFTSGGDIGEDVSGLSFAERFAYYPSTFKWGTPAGRAQRRERRRFWASIGIGVYLGVVTGSYVASLVWYEAIPAGFLIGAGYVGLARLSEKLGWEEVERAAIVGGLTHTAVTIVNWFTSSAGPATELPSTYEPAVGNVAGDAPPQWAQDAVTRAFRFLGF